MFWQSRSNINTFTVAGQKIDRAKLIRATLTDGTFGPSRELHVYQTDRRDAIVFRGAEADEALRYLSQGEAKPKVYTK